ncbi:MAG: DUF1214 domain-containing protein [Polyangiaceae bacterium]
MEKPENDESARRIVDGVAWSEFCDALKAAGNVITSDISPSDAFQRAEGYRYLTRLLRAALETFVEDADPQAPELLRTCHETIKMGADNPDNYYHNAPINGKYEYRISGQRGTVHYLGFGTQEGNYGATGSLDTSGYLDAADLKIDADGHFEIAVSAEKRPGKWLPMTPKSRTLVVRQTFLDKKTEKPALLKIERIGGKHAPRPLTPQAIDRGLVASARFVDGCARLFNQWAHGFKARVNELPLFDPKVATAAGGVPHIAYYHGYWRLQPDEALVIEVKPPLCDYWNFQLNNHWMESLDYRYHAISINRHSAEVRADGSVRVIVAHRDPGFGNWIDTAGHSEGTMCWRWVRAPEHPQPMTRVVKLEEL